MVNAYSSEIAMAIKKRAKHCPKDCISDDYHISSSTTDLHVGDHDDMHMDTTPHDDSIVHSAIQFFYPSFSFNIIKNHPQSVVNWLSIRIISYYLKLIEMIILVFFRYDWR